jgi:hypothetical protein
MYDWFPGADPSTISGVRKQNTRARPPKKEDVYLIDNEHILVMPRPEGPKAL